MISLEKKENMKEQLDSNTIIASDFNTPLSQIGHPDQKKSIKKLQN
jgi:hypothetical protein